MEKEKTMTDTDKTKDQTVKQKALAHFKAKLAGNLFKHHIDEWDCDIYYRATASMATEAKIMSLTQSGKTAEALVESIVLKSLDENGERLFKDIDRIELMNQADPNVIIKVASILNNANSETIGDLEKNL